MAEVNALQGMAAIGQRPLLMEVSLNYISVLGFRDLTSSVQTKLDDLILGPCRTGIEPESKCVLTFNLARPMVFSILYPQISICL